MHIRNSGSTPIDSVAFVYGVADSALQSCVWYGSLAPLADTIISLPASAIMASMSASPHSGAFPFIIAVTAVNGTPDVDQTNDTMRSQFIVAPNWPDTIVVKMLTSNLSADGMNLNTNPADASWYIMNAHGDTILSRTNTSYSRLYADTVVLPDNGFFKFSISTPGYCSGLHWWAFDQGITGYAPGYLQIKRLTGANLPMHGYVYATSISPGGLKNYGEHDDFGCGYSQYFYVSSANTTRLYSIEKPLDVTIYPNPANDEINIDFDNTNTSGSSISLINIFGQTVYSTNITSNTVKINSSSFAPSIYMALYNTPAGSSNIGKVIVTH